MLEVDHGPEEVLSTLPAELSSSSSPEVEVAEYSSDAEGAVGSRKCRRLGDVAFIPLCFLVPGGTAPSFSPFV